MEIHGRFHTKSINMLDLYHRYVAFCFAALRLVPLNARIVSLIDDSQTWTFSAPERTAVFHFSLWINAVCLAIVLGALLLNECQLWKFELC